MCQFTNSPTYEKSRLPIEQYEFWLHAIRNSDNQFIKDKLQSVSDAEKTKLLDGNFEFPQSSQEKGPPGANKVVFTRAWSIAVSCSSKDVITTFVKHGVNPQTLDNNNNNVLHVLVYTAFFNHEKEGSVQRIFATLLDLLPGKVIVEMLEVSNDMGLRPLELAGHLSVCGLELDMLETPGLHLVEQARKGINLTQWFDITEYEGLHPGNRRHFSPVNFLTLLDKQSLPFIGTKNFVSSNLMQKWIDAKYAVISPFIFLWFILRTLHMACYFIFDATALNIEEKYNLRSPYNNSGNKSCLSEMNKQYIFSETSLKIIGVLMLSYTAIASLTDVIEAYWHVFKNRRLRSTPTGKKQFVGHTVFYRVVQACIHAGVIAMVSIRFCRIYGGLEIPFMVDNLLYTLNGCLSFWSYMQFIQVRIGCASNHQCSIPFPEESHATFNPKRNIGSPCRPRKTLTGAAIVINITREPMFYVILTCSLQIAGLVLQKKQPELVTNFAYLSCHAIVLGCRTDPIYTLV